MADQRTIRHQMMHLLAEKEMNAIQLSKEIGIQEKEVYEHLSHIARSVTPQGKRLVILSSRCLKCGYVFTNRKRYTRPSRCPRCKDTHLQSPLYRIC